MAVDVVKHPVADAEDDSEDVGIIVEGDTSGTQRCRQRLCPTVCNHLWPEPELQYPTDLSYTSIHEYNTYNSFKTSWWSLIHTGIQPKSRYSETNWSIESIYLLCVVTWRLFSVLKYVVFVIPLTRAVFVISNSATVFILFFPNCCVYNNSLSW